MWWYEGPLLGLLFLITVVSVGWWLWEDFIPGRRALRRWRYIETQVEVHKRAVDYTFDRAKQAMRDL